MISLDSKSRTEKSLINVATGFGLQLLTVLLSFAVRVIFVKKIGFLYLGISSLFSNILTVLSVADLGFGTSISISLYSALRKADKNEIAGIVSYYKKIYLIVGCTIFGIGLVATPFISHLVNTAEEIAHLEIFFLIFLVNLLSTYIVSFRYAIIKADQKNGILNSIKSISLLVKSCLELATLLVLPRFCSIEVTYFVYLGIMVLATYLFEIWSAIKAKKMYPYAFVKTNISDENKKEIKTNVKSLLFYKICKAVNGSCDSILISIFVSTIILGKYDNYLLIISTLMGFGAIISRNVIASLGNFVLEKPKEEQIKLFNIIYIIYFCIIAFFFINYIGILEPFFKVFFGEDSTLSLFVLIMAATHLSFQCIDQVNELFRETTKMFRKTQFIQLINLIINISLSILLGYFMGLEGILLGTTIAYFSTSFWYETFALFKYYFNAPQKKVWLKTIYFVVCIISFAACAYLFDYFVVVDNNIVKLILSAVVSLTLSILCILAFSWLPETKLIKAKVKQLFHKEKREVKEND